MRRRALLLLLGVAAVILAGPDISRSASSSVTVSATVPGATSLTNNCGPSGYQIGTVLPGSTGSTATGAGVCSISFDSSNDSAMLRFYQTDRVAPAMDNGLTATIPSVDDSVVEGITASGASEAWAVENRGTVLKWNGTTWSSVIDLDTVAGAWWWNDIVLAPGTGGGTAKLWAVGGYQGRLLASTNGGTSWAAQTLPAGANCATSGCAVTAIDASSSTVAYAGIAGDDDVYRMIRTTDGTSWSTTAALPVQTRVVSIAVVDSLTAYYVGDTGVVYRTTDGGATWNSVTIPVMGATAKDVEAASASMVVVAGGAGTASVYNGSTWTTTSTGAVGSFYAAYAFSATSAVVAGDFGQLYTYNGTTWTAQPTPLTSRYGAITLGTAAVGFAGSPSGSIVGNGGGSWALQRSNTGSSVRNGIAAFTGQVLATVGDRGIITRSTNGGSSWSAATNASTANLWEVATAGDTTGFAVGDGGTVLKSTDAGATWSATGSTGTSARLYGVAAPATDLVYAVGAGGVAIKSNTGGSSWTTLAGLGSADLRAVTAPNRTLVIAVAANGTVYRSTNAGSTWTSQSVGGVLLDVSAPDATNVWVMSDYGAIHRSADGGATYTALPATNKPYRSIDAVDGTYAWVATSTAEVLRTTDAGLTWSGDILFPQWLQTSVVAIGATKAVSAGESNTVSVLSRTATIADFGAGNNWGSASTASVFGVCVQAVSAQTVPDVTVDTTSTPGVCNTVTADPWMAVPTTPTKLGHTTAGGQLGRADLVWGVRPADNQAAGTYLATVSFEVIAPWV